MDDNDGVENARLSSRHELIIAELVEGTLFYHWHWGLHTSNCFRCIPKMDHHCPWTTNCVSHFTFPHFMRFLFYAVVGMSYLESLLFKRGSIIWANRNLPSVSSLRNYRSFSSY